MTCTCRIPEEDHGDPRNLVLSKFIEAAEAANITLEECVDSVADTYDEAVDAK